MKATGFRQESYVAIRLSVNACMRTKARQHSVGWLCAQLTGSRSFEVHSAVCSENANAIPKYRNVVDLFLSWFSSEGLGLLLRDLLTGRRYKVRTSIRVLLPRFSM